MKKAILILLLIAQAIALLGCHPRELIHDVNHHPMPEHVRHMRQEDIKNIIVHTAAHRGWLCHQDGPGKLLCHCKRRAHQATIEILYNNRDFSIKHVSSNNMKLKEDLIHPKYNKWIKLLEREIIDALNAHPAPTH